MNLFGAMKLCLFIITALVLVEFLDNASRTEGLRLDGLNNVQKKTVWVPKFPIFGVSRFSTVDDSEENLKHLKDRATCDETGAFPIPNECTIYLECKVNGSGKSFNNCATGQLFDHLQRKCLPAAEAKCRDICRHEGDQYPDPQNSTGYLRCRAGVVKPYVCLGGKEYSAQLKRCVA